MKFFYSVILFWAVLQLVQTKSLPENSNNTNTLSPKKQLVRFYRKEFNSLARETCIQLKDICEGILKDEKIAKPITLFVQQFKMNITNFNIIYPFYVRFGMYEALARIFDELVSGYNDYTSSVGRPKDFLYIQKLLINHGYQGLRKKYKMIFKQFFAEKFIPKFQQLRNQIKNKSQLEYFENKFLNCVNGSKRCEDYECYLNIFHKSVLKLYDQLQGIVQRFIFNNILIYMHNFRSFYKDISKDRRVSQLSQPIRQNIKQIAESNFDIFTKFEFVFRIGGMDPLSHLRDDDTFELFMKILNDHGYEIISLEKTLMTLFDKLGKEIRNFKSSHTVNELKEDVPLWEILQYVHDMSEAKEIGELMMTSGALEENQIKKWKI